jgi:hypothetical protein
MGQFGPYQAYDVPIAVDTLAELAGTPVNFPPGSRIFVNAVASEFVALFNSGIVADGVTTIQSTKSPAIVYQRFPLVAAEGLYVDKAGSDTTGDGSFFNPFRTIQKAISTITTASATNIFEVNVGVGEFVEPFTLIPWVFVVGRAEELTRLSPTPMVNWIGAGFVAAGQQDTGIMRCTLGVALTADFAAVGSPGAGRFFLYNVDLDGFALSFTGNNVLNFIFWKNVRQIAITVLTHLVTNINGFLTNVGLRSNNLTIANTAAYTNTGRLENFGTNGTVTVTAASAVNVASWFGENLIANAYVMSGDGASLSSLGSVRGVQPPNADTTFEFGAATVPGSTRLLNGGDNLLFANNGADRTYTFLNPISGTRMRIKNQSGFFITLVFGSNTGGDTYIPPSGYWDGFFVAGSWMTQNYAQFGTGVLVNGVSAKIPADIALSTSPVTLSASNLNGSAAIGVLVALDADKTVGTRAGGGGFVVRSLTLAGAAVAGDQSSFQWIALRP